MPLGWEFVVFSLPWATLAPASQYVMKRWALAWREALTEALRQHPHPHVRRFVLPYRQARSEHKFYFESHDLEGYAIFEIQ